MKFYYMSSINLDNLIRLLTLIPLRIIYWPFMLFPVNSRKVVFVNFNGKGYGCNPKYICEALRQSDLHIDLVWLVKDRSSLPDDVRNVNIKSLKALWEFATAKVWVSNNRLPFYIDKKKSQYYLQTWHGCIAFKEIEAGIQNMPLYFKIRSKHDSDMIDLLMSNSRYCTSYFRKVFWYNKEIAEVGSARNDVLVNYQPSIRHKIRKHFSLDPEMRILLYAPTFRESASLSLFQLPFQKLMQSLKKKFGGRWVTLVRLHPILESKSDKLEYSENIINASPYSDFQELLAGSDVFITDYSSGLFDYINSRKPAFFYAPDLNSYVNERGLTFSYKELPCPFCQNIDELILAIKCYDERIYKSNIEKYFHVIGNKEAGTASKYFADRILKQMKQ